MRELCEDPSVRQELAHVVGEERVEEVCSILRNHLLNRGITRSNIPAQPTSFRHEIDPPPTIQPSQSRDNEAQPMTSFLHPVPNTYYQGQTADDMPPVPRLGQYPSRAAYSDSGFGSHSRETRSIQECPPYGSGNINHNSLACPYLQDVPVEYPSGYTGQSHYQTPSQQYSAPILPWGDQQVPGSDYASTSEQIGPDQGYYESASQVMSRYNQANSEAYFYQDNHKTNEHHGSMRRSHG